MKFKYIVFFFFLAFVFQNVNSQDLNNVRIDNILNIPSRREIKIPDISGYKTLKCDFHIHTLFSDGIVWPSVRIDEAWEEGIDVIAITDHIEGHPKNKLLIGDHNTSYDIAVQRAKEKGIILIKGGEISRGMPPGHINAIFLEDVNALDTPDVNDAIMEAYNQGAFIFWNHPGWKKQQPDTCKMFPIHKNLIDKGILHGIEVFNEKEWYPVALGWCLDNNLTIMGNSDVHGVVSHKYDLINNHRPITLVFSENKEIGSIKEALLAGRTVIYFDDFLVGKKEYLEAIFDASVKVVKTGITDAKNRMVYKVYNSSCIPYHIENKDGGGILLPAESTITIHHSNIEEYSGKVANLITGVGKNLRVSLDL